MLYINQIQTLFRQLMPTGRAFKGPVGGYLDKLNNALSISENKAYMDGLSTFDSMLLDSAENITTAFISDATYGGTDASDWERRLGLIDGTGLPMASRVALILQQYNYPGTVLERDNYRFIQQQLQLAGFNVFVYENRFWNGSAWITKDPVSILGSGLTANELADHQLGDAQLGGGYDNLVANSIDPEVDARFNVGQNLRSTFFIGGNNLFLNPMAYVPLAQLQQFRQLILKLKLVETVAYLFVQYI